jgi:hypothetical protein
MSPLFTHLISIYMRFSNCILHRFELWSSHILLDILCNEELLINRAGVVNRLETCLSPSSAFNLFISFNHETLKIINRQVFPLDVMYRRFLLTHEIIHGEFGAIECLNLKYALTLLPCQSHWDKCFEIHFFFVWHIVLLFDVRTINWSSIYLRIRRWVFTPGFL